jgi:hypothetical protein
MNQESLVTLVDDSQWAEQAAPSLDDLAAAGFAFATHPQAAE